MDVMVQEVRVFEFCGVMVLGFLGSRCLVLECRGSRCVAFGCGSLECHG